MARYRRTGVVQRKKAKLLSVLSRSGRRKAGLPLAIGAAAGSGAGALYHRLRCRPEKAIFAKAR
jgi:hypothetical protein